MKKGISLIVLVITIIVMIIIAGAIIISLNSSDVIDRSNEAVEDSNLANARSMLALKYAEVLGTHYTNDPTVKYVPSETIETAGVLGKAAGTTDLTYLKAAVEALTDGNEGYSVAVIGAKYEIVKKGTVTPAL